MTKKIKKSLLIISLLATSFLACGAVTSLKPISASATETGDQMQTETVETVDFATAFGASVRIIEPNGIRFKLQISDTKKGEIFAENSNKSLGMYIFLGSKVETYKDNYVEVPQKLDVKFAETDLYKVGDYWYANGVMTNLYIQNFNKEFVGVGYIATTGDSTTYEYSNFNLEDNVRSMSYVAIEAYKDPKANVQSQMVSLIEKAAYASYGVTETRTKSEDETITYSFSVGDDTWATYETMQTALPISMSVSTSEGDLLVGESCNINTSLVINETPVAGLTIPYEYSVEGNAVTLKDGVVTAAAPGKANVTVSFGKYTKTVAVNVVDTQIRYHQKGQPDVNMYGAEATVSLVKTQGKFTGFGSIEGEFESLCLTNGTNLSEIENLTIELINNELKFTTTETSLVKVLGSYRGNKGVDLTTHVYNDDGSLKKVITHKFYLTFADYVFTTKDQIRAFGSTTATLVEGYNTIDSWNPSTASNVIGTNGYFVLGGNIEFGNSNIAATKVGLYGGTFDGQGYSITGATFYASALFEYLRDGAVVKDLTITGKVDGETSSIIARFTGRGFTISNVNVNVNLNKNFSNKRVGLIGRTQDNYAAGAQNKKARIENCAMIVSVSGLTAKPSDSSGIWVGASSCPYGVLYPHTTCKNENCNGNYPLLTMENCISVIKDTNTSGYNISTFGSTFYKDGLTETNCNYFASWDDYNSATIEGYPAAMIEFIESCKS